jgi:hypothetical protein
MRKLSSSDKMLAYVSYNSDSPTVNGRYVHWEKLRRLPPIPEWTTEERWLLLKRARSTLLKPMPLRSTTNKNFHVALPEEALEQLHLLDRDAGSQILISEDILNRESQRRYVISSLMEEAITSSQIEGAATTRKDAKEMLRTGRLPRDHSERMILNNYRAMQHISSIAKQPLTQEVVFELHRILGDNALDVKDGAGRFRRPDEHIGVYTPENDLLHDPPPADQLPERMKQMCDFANGLTPSTFVHPVVRAIILHSPTIILSLMVTVDVPGPSSIGPCSDPTTGSLSFSLSPASSAKPKSNTAEHSYTSRPTTLTSPTSSSTTSRSFGKQ